MTLVTRRRLVLKAFTGVAAPVVGRLLLAAEPAGAAATAPGELPPSTPRARQAVVRRGRAVAVTARGDKVIVAHDQRTTIAILDRRGPRLVDVGGQPLHVAVDPSGRLAAVTLAFWDAPALVVVDLVTGAVRKRLAVGPAPFASAFTPDGRRLLVSGGEQQGTVHVIDLQSLRVLRSEALGTVPRGIAVGRSGRAWIAMHGEDRIAVVSALSGRVVRTIRSSPLPDRLALSPDGKRLLISHGGRAALHVSELVLTTGRSRRRQVGRQACDVAWTRDGRPLVVLRDSAELLVLGTRRTRRIRVPGQPRGVATAGSRAWTVDGLTGAVAQVRV